MRYGPLQARRAKYGRPGRYRNSVLLMSGIREHTSAALQASEVSGAASRVLAGIANGLPLSAILDELTEAVEQAIAGARCAILLVDPDGVHLCVAAAPRLPPEY